MKRLFAIIITGLFIFPMAVQSSELESESTRVELEDPQTEKQRQFDYVVETLNISIEAVVDEMEELIAEQRISPSSKHRSIREKLNQAREDLKYLLTKKDNTATEWKLEAKTEAELLARVEKVLPKTGTMTFSIKEAPQRAPSKISDQGEK